MPAFPDARPEDTVRAPGWDVDESSTFWPEITEAHGVEMAILLEKHSATLAETVMERGISEELHAQLKDALAATCGLLVSLKEWTLRRSPTPTQRASGQSGDIVPLTLEAIGNLSMKDFTFLATQMKARMEGVSGAADAPKGFPGGLADDPVPVGRIRRGRARPGQGHPPDGAGDQQDRVDLRAVR